MAMGVNIIEASRAHDVKFIKLELCVPILNFAPYSTRNRSVERISEETNTLME